MIKDALTVLNENELLDGFPEQTYQFGYVRIQDNKLHFNFNFFTDDNIVENIAKLINDKNYDRVIVVARSNDEPYTINGFPKSDKLDEFTGLINSEVNVFFQEPWPSPVPNFNLNNNSCVVRFGFDEGLKLNKNNVSKSYPITHSGKEMIPCLFTNSNIIPLC